MGACDVDGIEAASLIYPSSLLPTAFCIWFPWKSTFSSDLFSQELQADVFFNLHNMVIYEASGKAAEEKKGGEGGGESPEPGPFLVPVPTQCLKHQKPQGWQHIIRFSGCFLPRFLISEAMYVCAVHMCAGKRLRLILGGVFCFPSYSLRQGL